MGDAAIAGSGGWLGRAWQGIGARARAGARARSSADEAIILAGGKAERLGDAASGKPKALVPIAGRPLVAYQIALLAKGGVRRVIISCAAGQEELFERGSAGSASSSSRSASPSRWDGEEGYASPRRRGRARIRSTR